MMLAYPHEVVQNPPLTSKGVIVQNSSRDRELCFLRVAASFNPAVNLRDKAAQRRLLLRSTSPPRNNQMIFGRPKPETVFTPRSADVKRRSPRP